MKKSDIKNGMHVITMDGIEYIVIGGVEANGQIKEGNTANIIMTQVNGNGWMPFDEYDDDLRYHDPEEYNYDEEDRCYDIKEVYTPNYYAWVLDSIYKKQSTDRFTKVWERPLKKMTKAEIEKELGYAIEIVD